MVKILYDPKNIEDMIKSTLSQKVTPMDMSQLALKIDDKSNYDMNTSKLEDSPDERKDIRVEVIQDSSVAMSKSVKQSAMPNIITNNNKSSPKMNNSSPVNNNGFGIN